MDNTFDEAYAKYLNFLARLDKTDDISEKNELFRQLTEQLSELEQRLNNKSRTPEQEGSMTENSELIYWI